MYTCKYNIHITYMYTYIYTHTLFYFIKLESVDTQNGEEKSHETLPLRNYLGVLCVFKEKLHHFVCAVL